MLWRILDIHVTLSLKDCPLLQSSYNLYIFVLAFSSHKHEYLETFCFRADQSFNTSKNECFFSQWLNIQCLEKVFILSELEMILVWLSLFVKDQAFQSTCAWCVDTDLKGFICNGRKSFSEVSTGRTFKFWDPDYSCGHLFSCNCPLFWTLFLSNSTVEEVHSISRCWALTTQIN